MQYYTNWFSEQTTLSNGVSLKEEYAKQQDRIDGKSITSQKLDVNNKPIIKIGVDKLKKELFGIISIEEMPFELQEEFTRSELKISPSEWEMYSPRIKGKTIATEIIKGRVETIRRIYEHFNKNKRGALNGDTGTKKRPN